MKVSLRMARVILENISENFMHLFERDTPKLRVKTELKNYLKNNLCP
jgi:hypothetical protein